MLPAILAAVAMTGKKNKQIAVECDRSPAHITEWFCGRCHIPARMRKRVQDAIGAEIDWQAYEAEFSAVQAARRPAPAADAPPPAPAMPRQAPQDAEKRASPPAVPQPTQKPPSRPQAPSSASTGQGGILGFLISKPATEEKGIFDFG